MFKKFIRKYGIAAIYFIASGMIFVSGFMCGRHTNAAPVVTLPASSVEVVTKSCEISLQSADDLTIGEKVEQPPQASTIEVVATAYCCENYPHICNDGDGTITATGTTPTAGRTIAVDPTVIPYGTNVLIDGNTYIAEDCGGAIKGNRIDICFDTHAEALEFGRQTKTVVFAE